MAKQGSWEIGWQDLRVLVLLGLLRVLQANLMGLSTALYKH